MRTILFFDNACDNLLPFSIYLVVFYLILLFTIFSYNCNYGGNVGKMNYSIIREFDISNGPGVRVSLFCSGCEFHCKNCFNPQTWDFNHGLPFT